MSIFRAVLRSQGVRWCATNSGLFKVSLDTTVNCGIGSRFKIITTLSPVLRRSYASSGNVKSAVDGIKIKVDDIKSGKGNDSANEKEIIYKGQLARNIRSIKLFSLSTTILGLGVQPYVYMRVVESGISTAFTLPMFLIVGIFALLTPPLLNIITKRYILSVEYLPKEDKYIGKVYNLFAVEQKFEFTPEDVTIPTVLGMFSTCAIKGKPVFLDAKSFYDQRHYIRIMGYDKPLDLEVEEDIKGSDKKDSTKM